jgi:SAM-dependent methyltransferase
MPVPEQSIFSNSSRLYTLDALRMVTREVVGKYLPIGLQMAIEIGCGDGFFYREIMPDSLRPIYKGYDNHRASLEQFRQKSPGIDVELAEANNLDLADNSVDTVFGFSTFPLFNAEGVASELFRVVRPAGRVFIFQDNLITDPNGQNDLYSKMQRVEEYHRAIERKFASKGWMYKAGVDVAEAVVLTSYSDFMQRMPQKILDEAGDKIVIAATRDFSNGKVHFGTKETSEVDFKAIKSELGNPISLRDLEYEPGLQVPEFQRIRYWVAEKRSW